jgi:Peptidase family M1 domain
MNRLPAIIVVLLCLGVEGAGQPAQAPDPVAGLLTRLEQVLHDGSAARYLDLLSPAADRELAAQFARSVIVPGVTRAVVKERGRSDLPGALPGQGYRLLVEVLLESGQTGRVMTWRLDVSATGPGRPWGIVSQDILTTFQGLYRLMLNPRREFAVRDLVVSAEDLKLAVPEGQMFVADIGAGTTAVVVLGHGDMTFSPAPLTERSQLRLVTGSDVMQTPFDGLFIRVNPAEFAAHVTAREMVEREVDPRDLKRADDVFRQESVKSFALDLGDLSPDTWSMVPLPGDFLAEIRTRRFDTLTYVRASSEIEDISLFDRKKRHNISVYSSKEHLARYTRFYSDDDAIDYRVTSYGVDVKFDPERQSFEGLTSMAIETVAPSVNSLTVHLADSFAVRSVVSAEFGPLLSVRVPHRNTLVVNLPATLVKGSPLHVLVSYAGTLQPQPIDQEAIVPQLVVRRGEQAEEEPVPSEESYLYSNRSFWYAQAPTLTYAQATITVTVPEPWSVVASGEPVSVVPAPGPVQKGTRYRQFSFRASQPLRYLALLVGKFSPARTERISLKSVEGPLRQSRPTGVQYDEVELTVRTSPRLQSRGRELLKTAASLIRFYTSLMGDFPYRTLTVVAVERDLPGGHSPGYLALIAMPRPGSGLNWEDDPGVLPGFPDFFVAHELAHQWWGQAVGGKNYHEQWLSEGFAQYFAALYAERTRGKGAFDQIIRRMQTWAMSDSDQGPIYLGYRVGHVKGDRRIFRAVVYDKGAMVLHMLRRLMGDEAFFGGLRRFYDTWRFKKAGTDDLRRAMEEESSLDLTRFFDLWVLGDGLPQVAVASRAEDRPGGQEVTLQFEQTGAVYDVPVTVTIECTDNTVTNVLVKLTARHMETRVPVSGTVRRVDVNRDQAALGVFTPRPFPLPARDIISGSWKPSM